MGRPAFAQRQTSPLLAARRSGPVSPFSRRWLNPSTGLTRWGSFQVSEEISPAQVKEVEAKTREEAKCNSRPKNTHGLWAESLARTIWERSAGSMTCDSGILKAMRSLNQSQTLWGGGGRACITECMHCENKMTKGIQGQRTCHHEGSPSLGEGLDWNPGTVPAKLLIWVGPPEAGVCHGGGGVPL